MRKGSKKYQLGGETFTLYGPTDTVKKGKKVSNVKRKDITVNVPETILDPIQFLNSYYDSEEFKRKSGSSYEVNKSFYKAGANLYKSKVVDSDINGSHAIPAKMLLEHPDAFRGEPTIILDESQAKKNKYNLHNEVKPHEYTHTTRYLYSDDERAFVNRNKSNTVRDFYQHYLNDAEAQKKGQDFSEWYIPIASHKEVPSENYADLNTLRWDLYQHGIYDVRKGNMKVEDLKKAIENTSIKSNFALKRLLEAFTIEDIVELNNTVAVNDQQQNDVTMAKNGGKYKFQKGGQTGPIKDRSKLQMGGSFAWDMPSTNNTPSLRRFEDENKMVDQAGNTFFKQNNTGTPTTNNPDIIIPQQGPNFLDTLASFPNRTEDNPIYAGLRGAAIGVTGVANWLNNNKQRQREEDQYLRMAEPRYYENMERYGLNANPVYTKYGGRTAKYQVGGDVAMIDKNPNSASAQAAAGNTPTTPPVADKPDPYDQYYSANATLSYYKDKLNAKLKEKNPQAFADYFKGLSDLRRQGKTTDAQGYVQNTQYNEFLTPDEVKSTLGDSDYQRYIQSLQAVNTYNVSQGQQPLWGTEEGQNDVSKLNYGRRFASLQVTPSVSNFNRTRGTTYNRNYTYNPQTQAVDISESGDLNTRPSYFRPVPTIKFKFGGKRQNGGSIPETYGLNGTSAGMANVEAERGEAYMDFMGNVGQVALDAATHEQGGVMLPQIDRVLENTSSMRKDKNSKYLQLGPQQVKALTGVDTTKNMSHAQALIKANDAYEKQRGDIVKKIELAAKDRVNIDKYGENSVKLNMDQLKSIPTEQELFDRLFTHQEFIKSANDIPDGGSAKTGGKYSYKNGGLSRDSDYGSKSKPYPSVKSGDFAGGGRSYPIPTKADAIDALRLAGLHGRSDVRAKVFAKYPDLKKQLGGYTGNRSGMRTPAGNPDAFPSTASYTFQNYLDNIGTQGFKYEGITNPQEFQLALYDYALKNNPDDIKKMWQEGMHQKGMSQAKQMGLVDAKGNFKKGVLDNPANLTKLRDIYADGILGVRTLALNKKPPRIWSDDDVPSLPEPDAPLQELDPSITPPTFRRQPQSRFNEPLRWYDVASPTNAYISALSRENELYNPAEFNQLRYKLQDPTAALQANQADFNASVQAVQNTSGSNAGAQMANIANLSAQKYALNNQVLGQYENQNAQIKNQEILYNTQVRDRQSLADQQARGIYDDKVLTSKAKQQEQKLTAMDSLYKTIAENRALNRNGNLIMKFSRAFDQYGEYNGYAPTFAPNPALGMGAPTSQATGRGYANAAGGIQGLVPGKSYYNRKTGKTLYFDGGKLLER